MTLNRIQFIEYFAIAAFPIALAVSCSATAVQKRNANYFGNQLVVQEYSISQYSGRYLVENGPYEIGKTTSHIQ